MQDSFSLKRLCFITALLGWMFSPSLATDKMAWWKEAKFGMFIHWGIYAVPARGEWVMYNEKISIAEYEKFAEQFNPIKFNADEWVQIAKSAGQKYLVITSKHHDGFCMWDSKVTDYDIIDRTPFKRDVIRELADACERAGIAFGVYHSILDWHHPDALAGHIRDYRDKYLFPQVRELIENYHPRILWFDGDWLNGWSDADARALYDFCLSLDSTIIVNDRVKRWMPNAGDYETPEQEIPAEPLNRPWETCLTINWSWGYNQNDHGWKSPKALLYMLLEIVSKGGNLLLNVGPNAEGVIPTPSVERLQSIGNWLDQYGETVYGSIESPIQKVDFGFVTYKGDNYYLHVFSTPVNQKIQVPFSVIGEASANLFATGADLPVTIGNSNVEIYLTGVEKDPYATVITLQAQGEPVLEEFVSASSDGSFTLGKAHVFIVGSELRIEPTGNLGYWTRKEDYAYWKILVENPGKFKVLMDYAVDGCCGGNRVAVKLNDQVLRFTGQVTGGWQTYKTFELGTLDIPAGLQTISVLPDGNNGAYINLLYLYLIPVGSSVIEGENTLELQKKVQLFPAFPNPFNTSVTIRYSLSSDDLVQYSVYDLTGRSIVSSPSIFCRGGEHQIQLDASQWPTGIYFFVLNAGGKKHYEKILLVK